MSRLSASKLKTQVEPLHGDKGDNSDAQLKDPRRQNMATNDNQQKTVYLVRHGEAVPRLRTRLGR